MKNSRRGYTLIELVVAVGLFAFVMMLASGAYLMMIAINRQAQGLATGVDNIAFALETMTRTIRTGAHYSCNNGGNCSNGGTTFSVINVNGTTMNYALSGGAITQNGSPLTDPSVNITSLTFYAFGTQTAPTDYQQARTIIIASGSISTGPGKSASFTIETGATMRGTDIRP
jgi:prepilin-type N-terminal cleavage/methylation domain-containing protein